MLVEQDLCPGKIDPAARGVAGGEFSFGVVWMYSGHAGVSALRDRQLVWPTVGEANLATAARVPTIGELTALLFDRTSAP